MRIVRLSVVALLLAGCTTGTHTIGTIYAASKIIGPEGGTITVSAADDASIGGTSIVVPPGALSVPVKIGIYDATPLFSDPKLGKVIRIDPDTVTFSIPATAHIPAHKSLTALAKNPVVSATYGDQSAQYISATLQNGFVSFQISQGGEFASRASTEETPRDLESIEVSPRMDQVMPKGLTIRLAAKGKFTDGSSEDITSDVTWESMDPTIASFQEVAGELKGNSEGSTTVLARLGERSSPARNIVVTPRAFVSLTVEPAEVTCVAGMQKQLAARAEYTDGMTSDVTNMVDWHSDGPAVATVDDTGAVDCLGPGTASIAANIGSIVGSASITVTPEPPLISLEIHSLSTASVCEDTPMTAVATFSDQSTQDFTGVVTWMSGNAGIATVDSAGVVRCLSTGDVTISASTNDVSDSTVLSCGGATITGLALTPENQHAPAGTTLQMKLIATYCTGAMADITSDSSVSWSSSSTNIASVSSGGLVTSYQLGSATITATVPDLAASSAFTASVTLFVFAQELTLALTRMDGSQSQATPLGMSVQYIATVTYTDGMMVDVTSSVSWSSSNSSVATVLLGRVLPVSQGTTLIKVEQGGISATAMLTVGPAELVSIAVTPTNFNLPLGMVGQMVATGTFTDGSTQRLTQVATWMSSNANVAHVSTGGSVFTVSRGTTTIFASSGSVSGSAVLTVTPPVPALITVHAKSGDTAGCPVGTTLVLEANVTLTDGTTTTATTSATWTSSNSSIATVSPAGVVQCRSPGVARITAVDGSLSGFVDVTVAAELVSLSLERADGSTSQTTPRGVPVQYVATGTLNDGSTRILTTSADAVWTSSNPSVVTVQAGRAATVSQGTTEITVQVGTLSATTTLTVGPPEFTSVAIRGPALPINFPLGWQLTLGADAVYTDGSHIDVTENAFWTSSDEAVMTVSPSGVAVAVGLGSARITASFDGRTSEAYTLQVSEAVLASLDITPNQPMVFLPGDMQLMVTGTFTDGHTEDLTTTAVWTSSNESVATVSNNTAPGGSSSCTLDWGCLQSVQAGTATITATVGLISANQTVQVQ